MQALKDLLKSERGLIGLALLIGATTLTALGRMSVDQWQTYSMVIFGTYVAGKTVSGVAYAITSRPEAMAPEGKMDALAKLAADLLPLLIPPAPAAAPFPAAVPMPTSAADDFATAGAADAPSPDDVDTDRQRKPAVI
jgi:hypothetical protein